MNHVWRLVVLLPLVLAAACRAPTSVPANPAPTGERAVPDRSAAVPAQSAAAPNSPAADPPVIARWHVPHSSLSQTHAPLWMAIEQGYFRQRGLEIETSYISGGSTIAA